MKQFALVMVLALAACQPAPVGVRDVEVPRDSGPQCANLCALIGLPLDSVVIMANNVGCVCRNASPTAPAVTTPPGATTTTPAPPATPPGASASAGGMAAIMIAEEAARQQAARNAAAARPKH
jgi:hypothetical protein